MRQIEEANKHQSARGPLADEVIEGRHVGITDHAIAQLKERGILDATSARETVVDRFESEQY